MLLWGLEPSFSWTRELLIWFANSIIILLDMKFRQGIDFMAFKLEEIKLMDSEDSLP